MHELFNALLDGGGRFVTKKLSGFFDVGKSIGNVTDLRWLVDKLRFFAQGVLEAFDQMRQNDWLGATEFIVANPGAFNSVALSIPLMISLTKV